jgi:bacillopeptidase F
VLTYYTDLTAQRSRQARFYRVVDLTPQAVCSDNFEAGMGVWGVIDHSNNMTTWELGTPTDGPGAAHSGAKALGIDLMGNYNPGTEVLLRSPVIDLTALTGAVVEFWNYRDMDPPVGANWPDYGAVELLDANGESLGLPAMFTRGGTTVGWRKEQVALPAEALDRAIRLQFHFSSDFQIEGARWYIDDVAVLPK